MMLLSPGFAIGAAILSAAILILGRLFGRRYTDLVRAAVVVLLIGLALATPMTVTKSSEESSQLTAVVDLSRSFSRGRIKEVIEKLPIGTRCIGFGATSEEVTCADLSDAGMVVGDKTDLSEALGRANGEVLLLTDGFENVGSAELSLAADRNRIVVNPVVLDAVLAKPRISQVTHPAFVRAAQKIQLGVVVSDISNATPEGGALSVAITRSTAVESKEIVREISDATGDTRLEFSIDPPQGFKGLERFVIKLIDGRGRTIDSRVVLVGADASKEVLVISANEVQAAPFAKTLEEQGFKTVASRNGAVDNLSAFKAVVLVNTPRSVLAPEFEQRVAEYVRAGGTLIVTGGPQSFFPGGYRGSKLGELLPVNLLPPETVQKRLSIAVALVLDKSGSMAQGEKLDGAKGAAREVVNNLKDDDTIAVIGFDDAPFVVLRASPVGQVRSIAAERIGRLFPAGRTNLIPALDEARRMLSKVDAGRKHMIVMTDGRLPDESQFYFELLRQMRLAGITASTVLLGGENDFSFLKQMAEVGGGGFYQTSDPRLLPRIFLQDIKVSVDAPPPPSAFKVREVKPVSVKLGEYPDLQSVSPASVKDSATLELAALEGGDRGAANKPVLASWGVSNGRAIAFMPDVIGLQSSDWFRWDQFGEFWRVIISRERPAPPGNPGATREPSLEFTTEQRGEYTALNLTIFDPPQGAALDWRVNNPDGTDVAFKSVRETQPGRYRLIVKTSQSGDYSVRIADWLPAFGFAVQPEDFVDRADEGQQDLPHLQRLAELTGGTLVSIGDIESLAKRSVRRSEEETRIDYTWLACLLAFLAQCVGMMVRSTRAGV